MRGAFRDRHGRWVRDAVDAAAAQRKHLRGRAALMRTAKSCGPDAPTLAFKLAEIFPPMTVTTKPGHRGEHEISRKTIAQGRPGVPANLWLLPLCFFVAQGAAGAAGTRLSLRPLI